MLFSAKSYHGGELKERGVPFTVVPKAEVIPQAMALAKELVQGIFSFFPQPIVLVLMVV
jgi:polyketide biosynthesis enoyl-CoA hydratase PksI